jgi:sugar/nucleoside kinase (ribokinase family)
VTPSYDLVFAGNVAFDEIHPFQGEAHTVFGSAVYIAAWAAAWSDRKIALAAKMAEADAHLVEPLRQAGVTVYVSPSEETTYHLAVHPTPDVDHREVTQVRSAGYFTMADLPEMAPTLIHLASVTNADFEVDLLRQLRDRHFTCAVDMQGFVRRVDPATGRVLFGDVREKQEIAGMVRAMKLDAVEAGYLTGTTDLEEAAIQFEKWGTSEVMVTRSDGVLVRHAGKSYFQPFTNRSTVGRTGRGDTTFGSYLARRLDWNVADSLRFAAALVSIKMETPGPYMGTLEEVLTRMSEDESP